MIDLAKYEFADADVIAPEVYVEKGHPHEAFAWLRENDPLRLVEPEGYRPFWVERGACSPLTCKKPLIT